MRRLTILPLVCLALAACTGPACLQDQPYQQAEQFPALEAPTGLNVPQPDPNFAIPEVDGGPVGAFPKDAGKGKEQRRCLEMPPRFEASGSR